jgi:hypothetical protein
MRREIPGSMRSLSSGRPEDGSLASSPNNDSAMTGAAVAADFTASLVALGCRILRDSANPNNA